MKGQNGAKSTAGEMYGTLKERIIDGGFPPGMRLTEEGLALEFGTSRTPVREAMRLLVADGFLDFKPNSGTFVRQWTASEICEIFDLRLLLESEIAGLAAAHISGDEITELRVLQDAIEEQGVDLSEENLSRISVLNRDFHRVIGVASRNLRLVAMLNNAIEVPIVQRTFRRYGAMQLQRSFHHHRELIDAFAAHDGMWARSVMHCHINTARNAMTRDTQ
ncbi:Transcriptional regulator, GntR family [Cupriavidus necator H850]|uniref:GntR family transcriptional regulator n=1 Tax=Cupriavidus necator TaxID=106590 RepID=UPI00129E30B6|nr:GntR family transcriptional regulator [Cupriavidus necator]KAI3596434.1 Transcriptional regulator, GntR family [Cupriavidus necator H850]